MKTILTLLLSLSLTLANGNTPGKKQSKPILLKGGTVYTVTGGILQNTDVLFDKGRIVKIGKNLAAPAGGETIDVSGKHVYPGLISPVSTIGLTEIGAVRSTNDQSEVGQFTPEVSSQTAYNADSEIIPTVRSNGVTHALVIPQSGRITGRSSLMQLDAWNSEDATIEQDLGLHINWPNMNVFSGWSVPVAKQKENIAKSVKQLYTFMENAQAYLNSKKSIRKNMRYEAMSDYLAGKKTVFINANSFKQIRAAVKFADDFKLSVVLVGGNDALKAADMLKEHNIPVLLNKTQRLPSSTDSDYDEPFTLPAKLHKAGVRFAFGLNGYWNNFNLPFQAGQAVAYGLSKEAALAGLTINTAKILGVDDRLGSIEVGKEATLVVSEGDIMDMISHRVTMEFIEGRKVDLNNRHKMLYNKYKQKGK